MLEKKRHFKNISWIVLNQEVVLEKEAIIAEEV